MAAGSLLAPGVFANAFDLKKKKGIGVQVYSVRNELKEDFNGSMKKLADIGYKYIEGYGLGLDGKFFGTMAPADYNKVVTDLGMQLVATHCRYFTKNDAQKMVEASKAAGIEYLIIPSLPNELKASVDTYKQVAQNLNEVGEVFKSAGVKFGYHNHGFEFEEKSGQIPMEILISETEKELVTFEADLFWVNKGGYDPVKLVNKFPGRIGLYHIKDSTADLDQTTVGSGIIDFETLLKLKGKAGLDYYFVEDEREEDPFGNLEKAFQYLNTAKFG